MKKKIVLLIILSLYFWYSNGKNLGSGRSHTLASIVDTCQNKDGCFIEFSEKYLIALNYIVQKDSVLKGKNIRISETLEGNFPVFREILDKETLKIFYDSVSNTSYSSLYIGYKFVFPKFINNPKTRINGTLTFSKVVNNYLFVRFEPCCFSEKEKNKLVEDKNYAHLYCVKFNECGGIDKVYTHVRVQEWFNSDDYLVYTKMVELE